MGLNSQTGTEDSPVSSLNCDRPYYTQDQGRLSCDKCRLWIQTGRYCHVGHAATRCTRYAMTVAGKTGDIWVARVRVGVAYDWP